MRRLSKNERKIIKHLVNARKNNRYDQMQFAYILRNFVTYDYICWEKKEMKSYITTFLHSSSQEGKDVFYKIIDIIGLFEELKKKGFILIADTNLAEYEYPRYHYDKNKIKNDPNIGLLRIQGNGVYVPVGVEGDERFTYYGEIVDTIEKYMDSIIYPLQSLVDYKKWFYKTVEQRRHICATIISILAIILATWVGVESMRKDTSLNNEQLLYLESAIKEQKSISIDKFPDILPDTLNVKVTDTPEKQPINLNVTVKENQPTKIQ
ncbi:MAG: hypothetical protein IKJ59_12705 [Clostridia bacterium]|nr:hypothetical protein [Clostridia bacterium]